MPIGWNQSGLGLVTLQLWLLCEGNCFLWNITRKWRYLQKYKGQTVIAEMWPNSTGFHTVLVVEINMELDTAIKSRKGQFKHRVSSTEVIYSGSERNIGPFRNNAIWVNWVQSSYSSTVVLVVCSSSLYIYALDMNLLYNYVSLLFHVWTRIISYKLQKKNSL